MVDTLQMLYALGLIVGAILIGNLLSALTTRINSKRRFATDLGLRKGLRLLRLSLFLISLVFALAIMQINLALVMGAKVLEFLPQLVVLIILWLLGWAIISLIVDIGQRMLFHYAGDYLQEFGITERASLLVNLLAKGFLLLLFVAASLKVAALDLIIIDYVIVALACSFILFVLFILAYTFKDYLANYLLTAYVAKHIAKPGQLVRLGNEVGEIVAVTSHGVHISLETGYKRVIPNAQIVKEQMTIKRVRSDVHKLEPLLKNYIVQLKSHCGPASAAMMLDFFGYSFTQEQIGKAAGTKVRSEKDKENWQREYGTEPGGLIKAVSKLTKSHVKGKLISYDEITDLKREAKAWLAEGALLVLWYRKPVLFPEKNAKSGHFVLGVGVEDDSIIVMDPSSQTSGVYLVNYDLMEEAMASHDRERGYIVFAKKGSSAYWRLQEGLYYLDTNAYEDLSRSFEKYLKKTARESGVVHDLISPIVQMLFSKNEEGIKHVWQPDLRKDHGKK